MCKGKILVPINPWRVVDFSSDIFLAHFFCHLKFNWKKEQNHMLNNYMLTIDNF